jgi:flagellar FliL protein
MSEPEKSNPTSETASETPKKKSSKMLLIIIVVVLLAGGGGGAYYWFSASASAAESEDEDSHSSDKKSKSKKDSEDSAEEEEESHETEESDHGEKSAKKASSSSTKTGEPLKDALPDDEDVTQIVELQAFMVNLADEDQDRYLRLTVNLGVGGEEGAHDKPDPLFISRVRNAMLAVLAVKTSEEVLSGAGKAKLRKQLLKAAQAASEHPHVEAIYITDFIVQL